MLYLNPMKAPTDQRLLAMTCHLLFADHQPPSALLTRRLQIKGDTRMSQAHAN
jgi:hypothetical protein